MPLSATRWRADGSAAGNQAGAGSISDGRGSRSMITASRSVPATPSAMQWWIFVMKAQCPSSRFSTIHTSHKGRWRSSS